jgi:hypothetical protein
MSTTRPHQEYVQFGPVAFNYKDVISFSEVRCGSTMSAHAQVVNVEDAQ